MRYATTIVLMLAAGLLIGAGPVPKAGVQVDRPPKAVGSFVTPWPDLNDVVLAPDGSSVAVVAGRCLEAKVTYAQVYRFDGRPAIKVDGAEPFRLDGTVQELTYSPDSSKLLVVGFGGANNVNADYVLQTYDLKSGHRLGGRSFGRDPEYLRATFLPNSRQLYLLAAGKPSSSLVYLVDAESKTLEGGRFASAVSERMLGRGGVLFFSSDGKVMVDMFDGWPEQQAARGRPQWVQFRDAESKRVLGTIEKPYGWQPSGGPAVPVPVGRWVTGKGQFPGSFSPDDVRVGDDRRSIVGVSTEQARMTVDEDALRARLDRPGGDRNKPRPPAPGKEAGRVLDVAIDLTQLDMTGAWRTIRLDHEHPDKTVWAGRGKFSADGKHVGYLMAKLTQLDEPYRLNIHEVKTGKLVAAFTIGRAKYNNISAYAILPGEKVRVVRSVGEARPKADDENPVDAKADAKAPAGRQPRDAGAVAGPMQFTLVVEDYDFKKGPK